MSKPSSKRPGPCEFEIHSTSQGRLRLGCASRPAAEAFGAALRKTLLRSVRCARVSAVCIQGATHEFAAIGGVREDALQIVENLRTVRLAPLSPEPKTVSIAAVGPRAVTAGDLAMAAGGAAGRPDEIIATLDAGGRLDMTVEISSALPEAKTAGVGPRPGWIEVGADGRAIDRVAMTIETAGDLAELCLEVATGGTISPAEAVAQAAGLLQSKADSAESVRDLCQLAIDAARSPVQRPLPAAAVRPAQERNLNKTADNVPIPDLAGLQKQSYEWFVQASCPAGGRKAQGLEKLLRDAFPVRLADGQEVAYVGYEIGSQGTANPSLAAADCLRLGRTYAAPLHIRLRCGGKDAVIEAGRLPIMTERGTFIIAGREKVVLGQLQVEADTPDNDLATRRLLLVGQQLAAVLAGPLAADVAKLSQIDQAGAWHGRLAHASQGQLAPGESDSFTSETPVGNGAVALALPSFARAAAEFFARGPLARAAETTNPLALISQLRRVVQRGLTKEPTYDARSAAANHFGRLCLLETPEGEKIGVNLALAVLAGVDEDGRIVAPFRQAGGGQVEFLSPAAEEGKTLADLPAGAEYAARYDGGVLARRGGQIVRIDADEDSYRPAHSSQALGASAALIPLVAHDDPNRALMGSNMQKQAVGLLHPEAPLVRSGLEQQVVNDARAGVTAESDGVVVRCEADEIVIADAGGRERSYPLIRLGVSPEGSLLRQRPVVGAGDKVARGQILADAASSARGVLALGRNVLVGFLPWEGYNFEDSIVISDRLVRRGLFTSVKAQEFVVTVRKGEAHRRLGAQCLPAAEAAGLLGGGIAGEGQVVEAGEALIAAAQLHRGPDGGEAWRDASIRMPAGQRGTVVKVERYSAASGDALEDGVAELVRVTVAQRRPLKIGDKLANRHGAKGTVGLIVPAEDMPHLPDGRSLDIILDPLGMPSRMNIGQVLETHLGLAAHELNCTVIAPPFNGASVADIETMFAEAHLPASGMLRLRDGRTGRLLDHPSTVGYLHVLKLVHQVDDCRQARCRGEYSPQTQQPVGGRRHAGGQHIGVLETWALQAHAARHTLAEMLTAGSDDVAGRDAAYQALVSGGSWPRTTVPHSVKRLAAQLRGLCLDLRLLAAGGKAIDLFGPGASVEDAVSAGIGFAPAQTILAGSAGELGAAGPEADFDELFGCDVGGLAVKHVKLAAPVKHPWRAAVAAGAGLPDVAILPVLCRALRGGSSLNAAYLAVFAANEAAKKTGATPEALAALQGAVDRLMGDPVAGGGLCRLLRGKGGWVTAALSGKTVDYSARTVISPGCDLNYDECGLPIAIAKTLFEPQVLGELLRTGAAAAAGEAEKMLRENAPKAMTALHRVAAARWVLLHRAPTLHRLGIQAFRPRLTEEDTIRIHPLTMRAFNADFDGDQMDVYLPLSPRAQAEAAGAMRSSLCQLAPADGSYMNFPSQDMVFGCYYATVTAADPAAAARRFGTAEEVDAAFEAGEVAVHDTILLGTAQDAKRTTAGRAMFNRLLPAGLAGVDEPVTNGLLRRLCMDCWRKLGADRSAALGDAAMRFGFHHATLSGLSLGKDTLRPASRHGQRLAEAWAKARQLTVQSQRGELAAEDLAAALQEHWWHVGEALADEAISELAGDQGGFNSLHVMLASGARGNRMQVRNLIAMRGLLAMPEGLTAPIAFTTNMLQGHSPMEYLASTFGARRGLADTSLKTAEAGFLFKRITSAVQDVVVVQRDCGAEGGVAKTALADGGREIVSLAERIIARTAAQDVFAGEGGARPLAKRGEVITAEQAAAIAAAGVQTVLVRSPLTCRCGRGVCAACYGLDLATWQEAAVGLPVGIVAAQSIGEPMTQLTMRTFHPGVPLKRASAVGADPRETIVGGLPRMAEIFDAGLSPSCNQPQQRQALVDLLAQQGPAAMAEHLADEIHRVYRRQGVRVDDRHYEIVLREMLSRLRVTDGGDTTLAAGELVTPERLAAVNVAAPGRKAGAAATIVGVSEAAASADDFIAAAASHGGLASLARAAAEKRTIPLDGIRIRTALGRV